MTACNTNFSSLLNNTHVIPVITITERTQAVPLAKALVEGGLSVLEITLRTACALDAIQDIQDAVPDAIIGAGTVNTPELFEQVHKIGADFAVSPGFTDDLLQAADDIALPYLPGVATPSEAMQLHARGYTYLKMFPAEALGAYNLLKSMSSPLPDLKFCPTGGISADLARKYLALPNVVCVGGSWLTPKDVLDAQNWDGIKALATEAQDI